MIDGHEDEGRALTHGHRGRHVRAPHHIGGLGGDGPVVRLRAVRVAHAVRGLEVVLPHQPAHPLLGRADSLDPKLRPGFPVPFAMKRRRLEHAANMADQDVVRGGADRPAPARGRRRLPPRIHAGAGAVPHAADPLHARRPEIEWAPFIASTSAGPKGRPPPTGPPSRRAVRLASSRSSSIASYEVTSTTPIRESRSMRPSIAPGRSATSVTAHNDSAWASLTSKQANLWPQEFLKSSPPAGHEASGRKRVPLRVGRVRWAAHPRAEAVSPLVVRPRLGAWPGDVARASLVARLA